MPFIRDGDGVAKDYADARKWYEKAAAAGDANAMNGLGNLHLIGNGVPVDYAASPQVVPRRPQP